MKTTTPKLTARQKQALGLVVGGAGVRDYRLAQTLRSIERKHPKLILITKLGCENDDDGSRPYFGAITTAAGKEAMI